MAPRPNKRLLPPPKPDALKKLPGRKPVALDVQTAARLAGIGATIDEIAAVLGCSDRHVEHRMNEDPEFGRAIQQGRSMGRATLRRWQWQLAKSGNATMQIWLGKQMLGQRDYANIDEISASLSASQQASGDKVFKFTLKIGDRVPSEEEAGPVIDNLP